MLAGFLGASLCFWQGMSGLTGTSATTAHATTGKSSAKRRTLKTVPIGELRPGMRVLAKNPELLGKDVPERQIRPDFDRLVTFRLEKSDGSFVEWERIESLPELLIRAFAERLVARPERAFSLEPASALVPENADPDKVHTEVLALLKRIEERLFGRTIEINLAEMGVSGPAKIVSIAPCPEIEPDDGKGRRLITAVFRHSSGEVYDLRINGESSPIRCTGNHPFWSETRQEFIRASDLMDGEKLRQVGITLARVTEVVRCRDSQTVFNIKVDGEHVYFVGANGALVHNNCHGYGIVNTKTGDVLKIGVSRTGFQASGGRILKSSGF